MTIRAWQEVEENQELVDNETKRLKNWAMTNIGIKCLSWTLLPEKNLGNKKPVKRRVYPIDQTILIAMDEHINTNRHENDYYGQRI